MTPTGDPKLTAQLNDLLGRELGRNERGEAIFSWRWSEDMFWPARDTGRKIITETKVKIPIIGAPSDAHDFEEVGDNGCAPDEDQYSFNPNCLHCGLPGIGPIHNVYSIMQDLQPEYTTDRMVRAVDQWLVAKWMSPEELIIGGLIGHGMGWTGGHKPSHEALVTQWNKLYPGMDFPAQGWRIPTDARLPRGPQDPATPNLVDTEHLISRVREQTSMSFQAREADMTAYEVRRDLMDTKRIEDEVRDGFNAYLNPKPGTRGRASGGGFISMPWSRKDRL